MMIGDFVVDTGSLCFLCLSKLLPQFPPDHGMEFGALPIYSIQNLSRYLKIDMEKLFPNSEPGPNPPQLLAKVGTSTLKVPLCDSCSSLTSTFSTLYRELEKIEMELKSCLHSIHEEMLGGGEIANKTELFDDDRKMEIFDVLRGETIQNCSTKLNILFPRVKVQKLNAKRVTGGKCNYTSFSNSNLNEEFASNDDHLLSPEIDIGVVKLECVFPAPIPQDPDEDGNISADSLDEEVDRSEGTNENGKGVAVGNSYSSINPATGKRKCNICSTEFSTGWAFQEHYKSIHLKLRFRCKICNKDFSHTTTLTKHKLAYHSSQPFSCKFCLKSFSLWSRMDQHSKKCRGKKSKKSEKLHSLRSGLRSSRETENKAEQEAKKKEEENTVVKVIPPSKSRKVAGKPQFTVNTVTGKFKCGLCPNEFKEKRYFHNHYKSVHLNKRYKCTLCGKEFPQSVSFKRHYQNVHMKVRFKCDDCEQLFTLKANLMLHKRRNICGAKPGSIPLPRQKCHLCEKDFKIKGNLTAHIRKVHMNIRKYECDICGKKFKNRSHLKGHSYKVHFKMNESVKETGVGP